MWWSVLGMDLDTVVEVKGVISILNLLGDWIEIVRLESNAQIHLTSASDRSKIAHILITGNRKEAKTRQHAKDIFRELVPWCDFCCDLYK